MRSEKKIVIIGAGISGLTTAYLLFKEGYDVVVLEQKDKVGGSIETVNADGFLFDRGPNSGLETTPLIQQLVKDLNLEDQFVYANREGNKRYILQIWTASRTSNVATSIFQYKTVFRKSKIKIVC